MDHPVVEEPVDTQRLARAAAAWLLPITVYAVVRASGMVGPLLGFCLVVAALHGIVTRLRQARAGRIEATAWLTVDDPMPHLERLARAASWLVLTGAAWIAIVPGHGVSPWLAGLVAACGIVRAVLDLVPVVGAHRELAIGLALAAVWAGWDGQQANARPGDDASGPALRLPFSHPALVIDGGLSPLTNRHAFSPWPLAVDLIVDDPTEAAARCPGAPVLAPATGTIQRLGDDPALGRHVAIDLLDGYTVVLGHLAETAPELAVGTTVAAGDVLGRCGASGSTPTPRLHLHLEGPAAADGSRAVTAVRFEHATRRAADGHTAEAPFAVRRGDQVVPLQAPLGSPVAPPVHHR